MVRVTKMGGKFYGVELGGADVMDSLVSDAENIETFIEEGTPVVLAFSVYDAAKLLGIDVDEIEMAD